MSATQPLPASAACDNSTLDGDYAFLVEGVRYHEPSLFGTPGGGPAFPVVMLYQLHFDGSSDIGASSGLLSLGSAEVATFQISGGSYSVSNDCTGLLSFTLDVAPGSVSQAFVIVEGGNEVRLIAVDQAEQQVGVGRKQPVSCDNGSLRGTYGLLSDGFFTQPPFPATPPTPATQGESSLFPASEVLNVEFDGGGNITSGFGVFHVTSFFAFGFTISGTYSVQSDCTGTIDYTTNTGASIHRPVMVTVDDQLLFIDDAAFLIRGGTGKKQ